MLGLRLFFFFLDFGEKDGRGRSFAVPLNSCPHRTIVGVCSDMLSSAKRVIPSAYPVATCLFNSPKQNLANLSNLELSVRCFNSAEANPTILASAISGKPNLSKKKLYTVFAKVVSGQRTKTKQTFTQIAQRPPP